MVSPEYFRRQAEVCLRLARAFGNKKAAAELVAMADDFVAKADLIDQAEQNQRPNGWTAGLA
jgi:hypothetical protein